LEVSPQIDSLFGLPWLLLFDRYRRRRRDHIFDSRKRTLCVSADALRAAVVYSTTMQSEKYANMDPDEMRNLGEYDTIPFKTFSAAGSSGLAGMILGAITATWQDVPAVERNLALPAMLKTGRIMGNYGLTFAAIGGLFAFTEATASSIRGKKDIWNAALGGAAAGSILGLRGELGIGTFWNLEFFFLLPNW